MLFQVNAFHGINIAHIKWNPNISFYFKGDKEMWLRIRFYRLLVLSSGWRFSNIFVTVLTLIIQKRTFILSNVARDSAKLSLSYWISFSSLFKVFCVSSHTLFGLTWHWCNLFMFLFASHLHAHWSQARMLGYWCRN